MYNCLMSESYGTDHPIYTFIVVKGEDLLLATLNLNLIKVAFLGNRHHVVLEVGLVRGQMPLLSY